MTGRRRHSEEDKKEMATLYREGWSLREIAERFGCSNRGVHYVLVAQGVTMRPRGGHHKGSEPKGQSRPLSFMENPTKQLVRNALFHAVSSTIPVDRREPLRVLTLPGDAFSSPDSVESQLIATYDRVEFICLEKDKRQYQEILSQVADLDCKSIVVHNRTVERYLLTSQSRYDVVWLDICGGVSPGQRSAWMKLFRDWQMNEPSVFAVTVNESPRCRNDLNPGQLPRVIRGHAKQSGYRIQNPLSIGYESRRCSMKAYIFQVAG